MIKGVTMRKILTVLKKVESMEKRNQKCIRKKRYPTKDTAQVKLVYMQESNGNRTRDENLEIYPCEFCNGYHIGHKR